MGGGGSTPCLLRLKTWSGWKMEIWGKRPERLLAGWFSENMEERLTDYEVIVSWTFSSGPKQFMGKRREGRGVDGSGVWN